MPTYHPAAALRITPDLWDRRADLERSFDALASFTTATHGAPRSVWPDLDMIPLGHLQLGLPADAIPLDSPNPSRAPNAGASSLPIRSGRTSPSAPSPARRSFWAEPSSTSPTTTSSSSPSPTSSPATTTPASPPRSSAPGNSKSEESPPDTPPGLAFSTATKWPEQYASQPPPSKSRSARP